MHGETLKFNINALVENILYSNISCHVIFITALIRL